MTLASMNTCWMRRRHKLLYIDWRYRINPPSRICTSATLPFKLTLT